MKKLLSILMLLLISFTVKAQNQQEPVKVETSTSLSGDTLIVKVDFKVENDWMVYDSLGGDVGPIPLSINHEGATGLELIEVIKPHTKHKYDDIFEVDLWYFVKEASYELKYKVTDKAVAQSGVVSLEFMSCNLTSGVCLPPKIVDVSLK